MVQRAVLLASHSLIAAQELGLATALRPVAENSRESLNLEHAERELIRKALEHSKGNVAEAAKELGLSRSGLYRRLQKFAMI